MAYRPDINYPKFKDQFAVMDFEAEPLPVLSLYPMPPRMALYEWELTATDLAGRTKTFTWDDLRKLPTVTELSPLVCQIFNWSEKPEVTGVRLSAVLEAAGLDVPIGGYFAFASGDGTYFESLPRSLAFDRRTLLVFGINGELLPHELGGPVRLWVPFLQGYKSVKWLNGVRASVEDPKGIKRLLGQSKTAVLGAPGQERAGIVMAKVGSGEPVAHI
jgi:DMSO/TMAO reductase YedYZ molybdopterin-dependent catalytic subunit